MICELCDVEHDKKAEPGRSCNQTCGDPANDASLFLASLSIVARQSLRQPHNGGTMRFRQA